MSFTFGSEGFESFSEFGLHYIHKIFNFIIPEGHPLVKDWFMMKWWHIIIFTALYPFLIGNLRVYRFESHSKPVLKYQPLGFFFNAFSVVVYIFILYQVILYLLFYENCFVCQNSSPTIINLNTNNLENGFHHSKPMMDQNSIIEKNQNQQEFAQGYYHEHEHQGHHHESASHLDIDQSIGGHLTEDRNYIDRISLLFNSKSNEMYQFSESQFRIASILWFFHISRLFFDLINTLQSTLTRTVGELRSEQSLNEIRFTLTHFLVWWTTILYYPGVEVLYTVAVVCLFHLGTVFCALSQGKFIKLKMITWVLLVASNFVRFFVNLWHQCQFPASLLVISPPYDINNNVHMITFYFLYWLPVGALLNYFLYGRGVQCTWWTVSVFLICAHWPLSPPTTNSSNPNSIITTTSFKEKTPPSSSGKTLSAAAKAIINLKKEEQLRRELERQKEIEKSKERQRDKKKISPISSNGNSPTNTHTSSSNGSHYLSQHSHHSILHGKSHIGNGVSNGHHSKHSMLLHDEHVENGGIHHNILYRKCSYYMCNNYESKPKEFKVCQRCRSPYCSSKCQTKDWTEGNHKSYCRKFVLITPNKQ